jgi:hypothetical protein
MVTPATYKILQLLEYSMEDIEWQFSELTPKEKQIVGNQKGLDEIQSIVRILKSGYKPDKNQ